MTEFWESRYGNDEYGYGKTPNLFFKNIIDELEPGELFLPGDREGRNAVYAAELGWEVETMDLATTGGEKAFLLAAHNIW